MNVVVSAMVSFLLWHLTWGWRQLFIHTILFCFFLHVVIPLTWIRALLYSIFLHCITTVTVCCTIAALLPYITPFATDDMLQYNKVYTDIQQVTLSFALLYNICMYGMAIVSNGLFAMPLIRLLVTLFLSGITGALVTPKFICLM